MPDGLQLRILTPLGIAVEAEVSEVSMPGENGEFGVLPAHTPYLAKLRSGLVTYISGGRRDACALRGGLAEVAGDRVVILADEVFRPKSLAAGELDEMEKSARAAMEEAMDRGEEVEHFLNELAFVATLRGLSGLQDSKS